MGSTEGRGRWAQPNAPSRTSSGKNSASLQETGWAMPLRLSQRGQDLGSKSRLAGLRVAPGRPGRGEGEAMMSSSSHSTGARGPLALIGVCGWLQTGSKYFLAISQIQEPLQKGKAVPPRHSPGQQAGSMVRARATGLLLWPGEQISVPCPLPSPAAVVFLETPAVHLDLVRGQLL